MGANGAIAVTGAMAIIGDGIGTETCILTGAGHLYFSSEVDLSVAGLLIAGLSATDLSTTGPLAIGLSATGLLIIDLPVTSPVLLASFEAKALRRLGFNPLRILLREQFLHYWPIHF